MKDAVYWRLAVHYETVDGGGGGKGYESMDESSASSFYHEMINASGVVEVSMYLRRYICEDVQIDFDDELLVRQWKQSDG